MEAGHRTCLLEADPLGTVSNWRRRRASAGLTVETVHDGYTLYHRVQELAHRGHNSDGRRYRRRLERTIQGGHVRRRPMPHSRAPSPGRYRGRGADARCRARKRQPFAFVLNQVQARSARLNATAGSLGERAVALKIANVLALPAIVLRNDHQDALGMGLGVTEYAPPRKVGGGDPQFVGVGLGATEPRRSAPTRKRRSTHCMRLCQPHPTGTQPRLCVAVPPAEGASDL